MTIMLRSSSEPPEIVAGGDGSGEEVNQKTGLRGGFPIRINGLALGSQENLSGSGSSSAADMFGPRVASSRQGSVTPDSTGGSSGGGRRRSLRGTTPVKIAGVQLARRSPSPGGADDFAFATPFGPVQSGRAAAGFGASCGGPNSRRSFAAPPPCRPTAVNQEGDSQRWRRPSGEAQQDALMSARNQRIDFMTATETRAEIVILSELQGHWSDGTSGPGPRPGYLSDVTGGPGPRHGHCAVPAPVEVPKEQSIVSEAAVSADQPEPFQWRRPTYFQQKSEPVRQLEVKEPIDDSNNQRNVEHVMATSSSVEHGMAASVSTEHVTATSTNIELMVSSSCIDEHSLSQSSNVIHSTSLKPLESTLPSSKSGNQLFNYALLESTLSNSYSHMSNNANHVANSSSHMTNSSNHVANSSSHVANSSIHVTNSTSHVTDSHVTNSSSLENVISSMKNTLKSLKSQVTRKTLHEMNREVTPFDLPPLSPVPPPQRVAMPTREDIGAAMEQDLVAVVEAVEVCYNKEAVETSAKKKRPEDKSSGS